MTGDLTLSVTATFSGADARLLHAQAKAQGLEVDEYVRRATLAYVMSSWDRPVLALVA